MSDEDCGVYAAPSSSDEEDFEGELGDRTSRSFLKGSTPRRIAVSHDANSRSTTLSGKGEKQTQLRLRTVPGCPSGIRNPSVISSTEYYRRRRRLSDEHDVEGYAGGGVTDTTENEDKEKEDSDDDIADEDGDSENEDDDDEGSTRLKLPNSLLEAQWKLEEQEKHELQLIKKRDAEEEKKLTIKASHSRNQMSIWNALVSTRIHLQKVLLASQRLPIPPAAQYFHQQEWSSETMDSFQCSQDGTGASAPSRPESIRQQCSSSVGKLLLSLQRLEALLIRNNKQVEASLLSDCPPPGEDNDEEEGNANLPFIESRKRLRKELEALPWDWVQKESSVWRRIDRRPRMVIRWASYVADQWSANTSIKMQQRFKVFDQNPSAQVSRALRVDFEKLLNKTRPTISRNGDGVGAAPVLGIELLHFLDERVGDNGTKDTTTVVNIESYDDTDAYLSLLKETVRQSSKDSEILTAASQLKAVSSRLKRQEAVKKKKELDRRPIRYVPIPQLLSFMTAEPISYGPSAWNSDERLVDQFIASLFEDV